jgi:hypothetical protein
VSCMITAFHLWYTPEDRSAYIPIDIYTRTEFWTAYYWARDHRGGWLEDAQEVALEFVVEGEEWSRRTISIHPMEQDKVSVVIDRRVYDDSIAQIKYRVDLIQRGSAWEVEWAGTMHKCARDGIPPFLPTGIWGWQTAPCP